MVIHSFANLNSPSHTSLIQRNNINMSQSNFEGFPTINTDKSKTLRRRDIGMRNSYHKTNGSPSNDNLMNIKKANDNAHHGYIDTSNISI